MNTKRLPHLKLLPRVFERYPEIQAVYLFGSIPTEKTHLESDLDLAIVPGTRALRGKKLEILTDLARFGFCEVDLVFLDGNDIVLQYEAIRQNMLVYARPEFDRGSTYSKIVRQYLDFYPYLLIQRQAYKKRILSAKDKG
jgi:predicted nucleotidyltransferase